MHKILEVENVTKYYGSGSVITKALDGISLTVNEGDFTAIMGASGSGKSTLLNVIATIDRVSAGMILVDGKNISDMRENRLSAFRRDKLGFIFQDYNLLDTLTIGENITLPLNLKRIDAAHTEKELLRVSKALGVEDQLKKFPYELSGGQRQRAACARAIITNPALILADEPTGALDSANSKNLMKTFELMNQSLNSTILMVTHDAVIGSYAHRVLFLKDGKIWNELNKGDRSQLDMYHEILTVMAALGGDVGAH
ncbi:putative ABC transporter ATP-binding protein [Oscillibacter valericigenes Sjm18-20]|nr:putative ABC transporter ATP-binding protein [Oscillibacter valericigenes Sjm18-20]